MKKLLALFILILLFISITGCAETPGEGEAIYSVEYVSDLEEKVRSYERVMNDLDYERYELINLYLSIVDHALVYEDYLIELGYENFVDENGCICPAYSNDLIEYNPYDESSKKKILEDAKNFSSKDNALN